MDQETLYKGILGFTTLALVTTTAVYPLIKSTKLRNKAIRERYETKLERIQGEIDLLEKDNPKNSMYNNPEYMDLVIKEHTPNCRQAILEEICLKDKKVLGKGFLENYKGKAKNLVRLLREYNSNANFGPNI